MALLFTVKLGRNGCLFLELWLSGFINTMEPDVNVHLRSSRHLIIYVNVVSLSNYTSHIYIEIKCLTKGKS